MDLLPNLQVEILQKGFTGFSDSYLSKITIKDVVDLLREIAASPLDQNTEVDLWVLRSDLIQFSQVLNKVIQNSTIKTAGTVWDQARVLQFEFCFELEHVQTQSEQTMKGVLQKSYGTDSKGARLQDPTKDH